MIEPDVSVDPLVTIALPTYRPGAYLWLAVQSLLNQTMPDFELLIFDDWGGDDAIAHIRAIGDPRVKIIDDGVNVGLAARLNQAVAMARGRYFARMDHDDIAHPERLARQIAFLEERPDVDLLGTGCITINGDNEITGHLPLAVNHEDICRHPWLGFYVPHPTWIARLEWFAMHRYSPSAPYFCEDQEMLLRCHQASRYHVLPDRLLAYRVRSDWSLSKRLKTRFVLMRLQVAYFSSSKAPGSVIMSLMACLARALFDIAAYAGLKRTSKSTLLGGDECDVWSEIVSQASNKLTHTKAEDQKAAGNEA
ncbi:MAG: hypothetical protein Rhims3KO_24900 [Hyphomicrobiales bacterium]